MLKLNRVISAFIIATALYVLAYAEESLTITTYYPSPYGAYREMRVDQMSVGSGYRGSVLADGNLLVEGDVGIGTQSPSTQLDVAGQVKGRNGLCIGDECWSGWKVGTLVGGKWCTTDGNKVNCASDPPSAAAMTCPCGPCWRNNVYRPAGYSWWHIDICTPAGWVWTGMASHS